MFFESAHIYQARYCDIAGSGLIWDLAFLTFADLVDLIISTLLRWQVFTDNDTCNENSIEMTQ